MPVYKDEKRNTWYCKCNYRDWLGESKSKMKRGFATKKEALEWEREFLQRQSSIQYGYEAFFLCGCVF